MNNKGFAVSSVLYAILISFLLFLGVALAMFSSANNITLSANDDIVNGTGFSARRVAEDGVCDNSGNWISSSDRLIKINSRYGVVYWPHDFKITGSEVCYDNKICATSDPTNLASTLNKEFIKVHYMNTKYKDNVWIEFKDKISGDTKKVYFYDICK